MPGHQKLWQMPKEALANAKRLPPGSERSEAINKAEQLRIAADMKNWLTAKEPAE
jgi:hypothetical protein